MVKKIAVQEGEASAPTSDAAQKGLLSPEASGAKAPTSWKRNIARPFYIFRLLTLVTEIEAHNHGQYGNLHRA